MYRGREKEFLILERIAKLGVQEPENKQDWQGKRNLINAMPRAQRDRGRKNQHERNSAYNKQH